LVFWIPRGYAFLIFYSKRAVAGSDSGLQSLNFPRPQTFLFIDSRALLGRAGPDQDGEAKRDSDRRAAGGWERFEALFSYNCSQGILAGEGGIYEERKSAKVLDYHFSRLRRDSLRG
jgi:hypothetical protein